MCGIAGLFLKNDKLQPDLGRLTGLMLRELCDRGPDSAGFAVYGGETGAATKICMVNRNGAVDWHGIATELGAAIGAEVAVEDDRGPRDLPHHRGGRHGAQMADRPCAGRLRAEPGPFDRDLQGRRRSGRDRRAPRPAGRSGTHAIGHTRMATESAVTVAGSHPFSTGDDTCLVHNGSLSNHNRLREQLVRHGERFQTDNDSEVAAAYLASRLRAGDTLQGRAGERRCTTSTASTPSWSARATASR